MNRERRRKVFGQKEEEGFQGYLLPMPPIPIPLYLTPEPRYVFFMRRCDHDKNQLFIDDVYFVLKKKINNMKVQLCYCSLTC